MGKIRGTHSSPGIYSEITDLSYAVNSLGITTAALVGETLKGPAFEPIWISNKAEFSEYFGGVSAEKYKDSQYPRYELPYIAESFLSASDQLYVCRVLGLSGYNAGPAFIITASKSGEQANKHVVAVLRSRGHFNKFGNAGTPCEPNLTYDSLEFDCDSIELKPYTSISTIINGCGTSGITSGTTEFTVSTYDLGHFTIVAKKGDKIVGRYPVSLNAGAQDYIYKVLGSKPTEGSAAVYVEDFYDNYFIDLIEKSTVDIINDSAITITAPKYKFVTDAVADVVTIPSVDLTKRNVGQTFVYAANLIPEGTTAADFNYKPTKSDDTFDLENTGLTPMVTGEIYKVRSFNSNAGKTYVYTQVKKDGNVIKADGVTDASGYTHVVEVRSFDAYAYAKSSATEELVFTNDIADYREQFRYASTPWIVSELKGNDPTSLEVKKLFRFHTISDGNCANTQIKVMISNVRPDEGLFDVTIRDYYDSDANMSILESYKNLTMVPGDARYIGLKIGTADGAYESVSKYVVVEIIENDMTAECVPAGFLGYPIRTYDGLVSPTLKYNVFYDEDIKERRQCFGISDIAGIDDDMFTYKGKNAYTENYTMGYTNGFHLDSTLSKEVLEELGISGVTVDGIKGITFDTVSLNNVTDEGVRPLIGSETDMAGSIYENVTLRKFTVCPFGGFDGWDIYRNVRTTSNDYKANKYKGSIENGHGATFSRIKDGTGLALEGNCITSDYYAWLAGVKQFESPEKNLINLIATPGIDYVNDNLLSKEILDVIEKRADTLYIMTTPDKPFGASDAPEEMYSSSDAKSNFEDSDIDTFFAATYYPWIKYEDKINNIFINLPATKDVLRNLANIDNKKFPWFAPAGLERGTVECKKLHVFTKLEDEDTVYDSLINPLKSFSKDGVKIWGQKTMYSQDTPMNRINVVRLMLYLRKLINEAHRILIFDQDDTNLADDFEKSLKDILIDIKSNRGLTDSRVKVTQTVEQRDAHEMSAKIWVKPTPTLEYIEISFIVTPEGVTFED